MPKHNQQVESIEDAFHIHLDPDHYPHHDYVYALRKAIASYVVHKDFSGISSDQAYHHIWCLLKLYSFLLEVKPHFNE